MNAGKPRPIVDPMASWLELPPWPEGPRIFAEVDTATTRYINLRPNDVGVLPTVQARSGERLDLRFSLPEGEPGERIFVEIPNGGVFVDSEERGRVFVLPDNLTVSFPFIADDAAGHCNVKLRHRGHTRSLPVWVDDSSESNS